MPSTPKRATDADQRGEALNDLGISLKTLGARESGIARLQDAVTSYRAALEERTREPVPLNWAGSWGNLGVTLAELANRTDDLAVARPALAQVVEAETVLRAGGHLPFADQFTRTIPTIHSLMTRLT